jgi:hypothetical protein
MSTTFHHGMSRRPFSLLLAMTILGLAGCSDLASLLRDELAMESEYLDRLSLVVNDDEAKEFARGYADYFNKTSEKLREKKMDMIGALDKAPRAVWTKYEAMVMAVLVKPVSDDSIDLVKKLGAADAPQECVDTLKGLLEADKALPKDWDKVLAVLPPAKVLNRYMREKLALKISWRKEIIRLENSNFPLMKTIAGANKLKG